MANPFTPEQSARIRQLLETEPCLFNARHYLNHAVHRDHMSLLTMANWLNEVGGRVIATPEIVAEILDVAPPGSVFTEPEPQPRLDVWADARAKLGDVVGG